MKEGIPLEAMTKLQVGRFAKAVIVAKRARQLSEGRTPLVIAPYKKTVPVAIEEVAQELVRGKVKYRERLVSIREREGSE